VKSECSTDMHKSRPVPSGADMKSTGEEVSITERPLLGTGDFERNALAVDVR